MNPQERITLGRQLILATPQLKECVATFHRWLPEAIGKVINPPITPEVEGDSVIAVNTPFGRLVLMDRLTRQENELIASIIFYEPASSLFPQPKRLYTVVLRGNGAAYFGHPAPENEFTWDHRTDTWSPSNILRLGYEIAIACTAP